ncbi:hypothetical protein HDV05_003544 [Chytridiales sp. JEL 0842]|nr:hypothetical protein HDV05_003544 [Chytridiales sp. JEL 0842]
MQDDDPVAIPQSRQSPAAAERRHEQRDPDQDQHPDSKDGLIFLKPRSKKTPSRNASSTKQASSSSWAIVGSSKPWTPSNSNSNITRGGYGTLNSKDVTGTATFMKHGSRAPMSERDAPKEETSVIEQVTIQEDPHSTNKPRSWRRRYNFNKIRFLAGWEKIDLLRQFHAAGLPNESMFVYLTLKKNGLMPRLKYLDHHNMFRLMISNPVRNYKYITMIWDEFHSNGFLRTANAYAAMIVCIVRWGNRRLGRKVYNELKADKLDVPIHTYNHLIKLFSTDLVSLPDPTAEDLLVDNLLDEDMSHWQTDDTHEPENTEADSKPFAGLPLIPPSQQDLELATEIYTDLISQQPVKSEPNINTYTLALQAYALLKNLEGVQKTYTHALESIPRLRAATLSTRPYGSKKSTVPDPGTDIGNAAVAAFLKVGDLDGAERVVGDMSSPGQALAKEGKLSKKRGVQLLNLLLKMALLRRTEDPKKGLEMAMRVWNESVKRRGVEPDMVSYGLKISILGAAGNVADAEEWFEIGVDRLGLKEGVGSGKLMKLRTSLLQGYALAIPALLSREATKAKHEKIRAEKVESIVERTMRLMEKMKDEGYLVGKTPLRSSYMYAIETLEAAKMRPDVVEAWKMELEGMRESVEEGEK